MTVIFDVYLLCDTCGARSNPQGTGFSGVMKARRAARESGWTKDRIGRDVCADCR